MSTPVLFLAFANDRDAHLDMLKEESSEVYRALQDLDKKEYVKIHREESADVRDLFDIFSTFKDRVAIFHYAGHAGGTHLRLEGGAGDARGLAQLMGEQDTLKLVFLNGCSTQGQVETLMEAGVKAVIATSVSIQDKKAQEFAVQFYQALANRRTIGQAFKLAQAFLKTKYGDRVEVGIQAYRSIIHLPRPPGQAIPWGLYVKDDYKDEVLGWKLPNYHPIRQGLPQDEMDFIKSFKANRYIVQVLDEMTKYNPDIYDQMVVKRGGEDIKKDSREYPEIIINNFPWPVGSQIRLLKTKERADLMRLKQLVSTYLFTSQMLYYILLSDLWENMRRGTIHLPEGFQTGLPLDAAGYGSFDFLAQTAAFYEVFAEQGVPPYVREYERLAETWRDEDSLLRKRHRYLEKLRVRLHEDLPTTDLDKWCNNAEQAVSTVLGAAAFLACYHMLTVRDIMIEAPRFKPVEYELDMGPLYKIDAGLYKGDEQRIKNNYTNSDSVVLAHDENRLDDCLNLSPFIIDKNTFARVKKSETTHENKVADVFVMAYEEADEDDPEDNRLVYLAVKDSLDEALKNELHKIHTRMTQNDFEEGRNDQGQGSDDADLGEDGDFEDDESDQDMQADDSPRVFAILQEQYEGFKADMLVIQ